MKSIPIKSEQSKTYAKSLIDAIKIEDKCIVEIKKVPKDPTYDQQKLWFLWCGETANSGLGSDDNTNDVHITAKWRFVRPVLLEENELFGIIYNQFMKTIEGSVLKSEYCKEFADKWIHTNSLTRAGRIKSLDAFWKYWCIEHGVNLTDPKMQGVDLR